MLAGTGKKSTMLFTELCEKHRPRGLDDREYLCSDDVNDVRQLYTHYPVPRGDNGVDALTRRLETYENGAKLVRQALADRYGADVAKNVLAGVERKTGRDLEEAMTRGDLDLLHEELQFQELQELRNRVKNDTPEMVKEELAQNWASAGSPFDIYWLNGIICLPESICWCYVLSNGSMQFDEKAKTLTLTRGIELHYYGDHGRDQKKKHLTDFIGENFGVRPGEPAFQDIASNILSYLSCDASVRQRVGHVVLDGYAPDLAHDAASMTFTLSVGEDGDVRVVGDTSVRFEKKRRAYAVGEGAPSTFRFVRREGFKISGKNLKSRWGADDAKANLLSVDRFDTVEFAT